MQIESLNYKMLPQEAKDIVSTLTRSGYQAYIVGGAVRDSIMGNTPKDLDFATDATPETLMVVFKHEMMVNPNVNFKLSFHGKCFGVCTVNGYEVATFRKDVHSGSGDKCCSVEYTTSLEEDLSRRDFTINSMAYDPISGVLVDSFQGVLDLRRKHVRAVGDPNERLWEDPNRAFRALRMAATIGGRCTPCLVEAIKGARPLIRNVPPDRIRTEILKAMCVDKPSTFWNLMVITGLLEDHIPPMIDMYGFPGGPCHGETVWDHAMACGDALPKNNPLLRLSGYLHDIGKPATYNHQEGTFHGHMAVGSSIASKVLSSLRFSRSEIDFVKCLVKEHMFDPEGPRGKNPNRPQKRLIRRLRENGCRLCDWLRLHIADVNANQATPKMPPADIKGLVAHFDGALMEDARLSEAKDLPINGKDVMRIFNMSVGTPLVGDVLRKTFEYAEEFPEKATREGLLHYVENLNRSGACL